MRPLVAFMLLLLLTSAHAYQTTMKIFAVTSSGKGLPADLVVDVVKGSGNISISIGESIVGADTQQSVRDAIRAATALAGVDYRAYDYSVAIHSPAERIDGPSAGLAIALATYGAINNMDVPEGISATGQITDNGEVLPVGGIFEKVKAAHEVGIKIFLIPKGERKVVATVEEETAPGITETVEKTIDIVEYAKEKWGMDVYEVDNLRDAVEIVFEGKRPENTQTENTTVPPEFTPPQASTDKSEVFRPVAEDIIGRAEKELSAAKGCNVINASGDASLISTAEEMLKEAKKLVVKGYYYTAANYAFLAKINAETYRLLCEHPSMRDSTSVAFQDFYDSVYEKVKNIEALLDTAVLNKNNFEWIGAARDRIIRAKSKIEAMPVGSDETARLMDVVAAKEWAESAKRFYEIGKDINGPELLDLSDIARAEIIALEDSIVLTKTSDPDILERKMWARMAYERGWYYTAALEAASGKGILMGRMAARSENPLSELESALRDTEAVGVWDELYFNHARYYYLAAVYYRSNDEDELSENMVATGLEIYYMAKGVRDVNKKVQASPVIVYTKTEGNGKDLSVVMGMAVLIGAVGLSILLVVMFTLVRGKKAGEDFVRKKHEYLRKINEIEREMEKYKGKKEEEARRKLAGLRLQLGRYRKKLRELEESVRKGA